VPFLNLAVIAALIVFPAAGYWPGWTWCLAPAWLLIVPPIVVRVILTIRPLPRGEIAVGSSPFLVWWLTSQWQIIFNRLPWIEEIIRLVPGFYAVWLRLWGARVGKLVYWTPGLRILDRSLLDVGDRVVFGVGVKIAPHIIMPGREGPGREGPGREGPGREGPGREGPDREGPGREGPNREGRHVLLVAPVRIGSDVLVGAYSILLAGSWIAPGEASPGRRELPPNTGWVNGRRVESGDEAREAANG
jgi:acetyltransferase-like isoleucine patch superfamily enzyme